MRGGIASLGRRGLGGDAERGAGMVELALILPLIMMLLLGIITGAAAYGQKLALTNGAREGARFAATYPTTNNSQVASMNQWLDVIATRTKDSIDGGFPAGLSGRSLCVAYVYPNGNTSLDQTTRRIEDAAGNATYATGSTATCFSDTRGNDERRVQIAIGRNATINAYLYRQTVGLSARSIARFEAFN
jgi:hypothetical protein